MFTVKICKIEKGVKKIILNLIILPLLEILCISFQDYIGKYFDLFGKGYFSKMIRFLIRQ